MILSTAYMATTETALLTVRMGWSLISYSLSTKMEFQDSESLVDILWIIFNDLEKVFFALLMIFLLAGWKKILLSILREPLFPRCHR
jgi:hypothetical protein